MLYMARSVYLVGCAVMGIGLIWVVAIWKGAIEILPEFWDQPLTALAFAGIGFVTSIIGKSAGGDVFGDESLPSFDLMQYLPRRKAKEPEAKRIDDYREMLDNEGAQFYQPGQPEGAAKPDYSAMMASPEVKQELISHLLQGGAKAVASFEPGTHAAPTSDLMTETPPPPPPAASVIDFKSMRLRLQACFPQRPTNSWIGGGPSLPASADWPMLNGVPASFFAQIALADLPADLWGGLGPRAGWLVIFGADDPGAEAIVLHTLELGEDRMPPEGADYYFKAGSGVEELAELIGPEALQPPRWYLEVSADEAGPRRNAQEMDVVKTHLGKPSMTDPAFLPFDWPTAVALLDSAEAMMLRLLGRAKRLAGEGDNAAEAQLVPMAETLARLRLLARKTEERAESTQFDEGECARLIGALAKLTNAGWQSQKAQDEGRKPLSLLQFQGYESYRRLFEAQARRVYCANPEDLPKATRDRLEPIWQELAANEALYMGSAPGDKLPVDAPCLLMLPCSDLAGWQIGESSRWAVQISPQDLAEGHFAMAFAQNGQGKGWDR